MVSPVWPLALAAVAAVLLGCDAPASPTAPLFAVTATRQDVSVAGAGVTLGGILYRPETAETRPGIIVLHGWQPAGTNGAALVEARARRYSEDGYVALALSMRGWPPSNGADDCGLVQPDDVARAVEWLGTQPGVNADRIGLVGFSQGGQVALLAAARRARVRAVVAYYPVTDVARWKTTTTNTDIPGYITAVCEPGGVAARSPLVRASDINLPLLLVHGDRDTRVPTEQSTLLHEAVTRAGGTAELFLVPGAQHGFVASEEAVARPVVDRFLTAWLR